MNNPYLEKAKRAIDDRVGRPSDELQALALVAIAFELEAIRLQLQGGAPMAEEQPHTRGVVGGRAD